MPSAMKEARRAPSDHEDVDGNISPNFKSTRFSSLTTDHEGQEGISPLMLAKSKEVNDEFSLDCDQGKSHRPHHVKKLSKKFSHVSSPIFGYAHRNGSTADSPSYEQTLSLRSIDGHTSDHSRPQSTTSHRSHKSHVSALAEEVAAWLRHEKAKKKARKSKRASKKKADKEHHVPPRFHDLSRSPSAASTSSSGSLDLDRLESILTKRMRSGSIVDPSASQLPAYGSSSLNLRRIGSRSFRGLNRPSTLKPSEVESAEDDVLVPSCDVVLDNSKTLSFAGGAPQLGGAGDGDQAPTKSSARAWSRYKHEIVRLSHTLKLKGWRQVPMSQSDEIHVERLSGALTNAVYVVAPPDHIKLPPDQPYRKPPVKLLLRIYGSNTDQLIDRESELNVLKRLAKKHIGPRMLATFANGRFEEFLHAQTLKPQDLRVKETSIQIAKRMRELHDGIELLDEERENGPFVWLNWDKCVERAEKRMEFLDRDVSKDGKGKQHVCGTSWSVFRRTVEHYRQQLEREYGGRERLNDQLVFAHNDTQYGNILRLEPPGESPLLLPANVHKQLVVIDFEYANANVPGLEFANHFTEWCYNYHDPATSFACNTQHYPTPEEQLRFIRAYVSHHPNHAPAAPTTPRFTPLHHTGSFTSLTLEKSASYPSHQDKSSGASYFPGGQVTESLAETARKPETAAEERAEAEAERNKEREVAELQQQYEEEVNRLMRETQLWRIANSAQWVVWGILQAAVPDEQDAAEQGGQNDAAVPLSDPLDEEAREAKDSLHDKRPDETEEAAEEFDYLAYSRERAMFFWGDCLQMGLVREADLGREVARKVKIVPY